MSLCRLDKIDNKGNHYSYKIIKHRAPHQLSFIYVESSLASASDSCNRFAAVSGVVAVLLLLLLTYRRHWIL
jgi:hypothetical protein